MDLAPGTVVDQMITESMTAEDIAALKVQYGLDKPLLYRYGQYMFRLVQGDLGLSEYNRLKVWDVYISRLPNTLLLAFLSLILGSVFAVPLGIIAARRSGTLIDNATTLLSLVGMSMPGFWLGLLLLLLFALNLQWLPAGGNTNGVRSVILPAVCSGFMLLATCTRQTRSSMLEVLNADYLRTARAKGVPEETVIRKHALGNAWIPILTTMGNSLSVTIAGSAVIESVFAWPGVGRTTVDAVLSRDVTLTLGCVIMTTFLYVFVQLLVDIMYAAVDPRIKSQFVTNKKKRRVASEAAGRANRRLAEQAAEGSKGQYPVIEMQFSGKPEAISDSEIENTAPLNTEILSGQGGEPPDTADSADKGTGQEVPGGRTYAAADSSYEPVQTVACEQEQGSIISGGEKSEKAVADVGSITKKYKKRSQLGGIFHSLRRNKGAMAAFIILAILLATFVFSLFLSFETVTASNAKVRFSSPSLEFPFGTDNAGRNLFLRVIYGIRYSLAIGFGSVGIAVLFGVMLGSVAGYYGGYVENIIMRAADVLASVPGLLLGMVIMTVLGQSLQNLIIAVGITSIPVFTRISRASILTVRNHEFVEAARAIGFSDFRTIFSQVLPNGLSPVIVTTTGSLGVSIIIAASLSYLGFGVPVPHPEWGALISAGRDYARSAPWLMTFPGLSIMLIVLALNLLGDGLRDALDPKLKR